MRALSREPLAGENTRVRAKNPILRKWPQLTNDEWAFKSLNGRELETSREIAGLEREMHVPPLLRGKAMERLPTF
jgi:hypothetical protein